VLFWLITTARYLLAALVAILLSVALSFFSTFPWARAGDSPALGFLWFFLFIAEAAILVPLCLGITAELVEQKAQERRFKWSKALSRFLLALPIVVGPIYSLVWVHLWIESRRPAHWFWKEVFFYCLSAFFLYFALRIRRQSTPSRTNFYELPNS